MRAWLTDMLKAIELVRSELDGITIQALEADRRKQWIVERGIEIVSEASRHLTAALKAGHPGIPWRKAAGTGSVLRHEYQRTAPDILWHAAGGDLPALEVFCRAELNR